MGQSIASNSKVPSLDVDAEMKLVLMGSLGCNANTCHLLGMERARKYGWRNTYEFTKAMGEMLLNGKRGNIPVVIIRPSIIGSIYSDPFRGWIEGYRMLDPIFISYGRGQLPGFFVDADVVADFVPLDMVVNAIIAAIAKHGIAARKSESELKVYQVASSVANPVSYENIFQFARDYFTSCPLVDSNGKKNIQIAGLNFFGSMDSYVSYMREELSAQQNIAEAEFNKRLNRSIRLAEIYQPYMFQRGWFDNSNTKKLIEGMSIEEKKLYGFDVESINWKHYKSIHFPGLRRHVIKEKTMAAVRL